MRRGEAWAIPAETGELRSATRDGVRLGYREAGAAEAPALVFVHGWGCDHRFFGPQVAHFAARHRVIAVDQRGCGSSDKPSQAYSIEGAAEDLAWLCAELGIETAAVVGHSQGGAVALALASRRPELCAAVALCDPAVFLPAWAIEQRAAFIAGLASPGYREVMQLIVDRQLFLEADDADWRRWILEAMCETPQHVLVATMEAVYAFDAEAAASACRAPTLCIESEEPLVERGRLRAHCPSVEVTSLPGVGHFHQLLAPREINDILERFVARRGGSRAKSGRPTGSR